MVLQNFFFGRYRTSYPGIYCLYRDSEITGKLPNRIKKLPGQRAEVCFIGL